MNSRVDFEGVVVPVSQCLFGSSRVHVSTFSGAARGGCGLAGPGPLGATTQLHCKDETGCNKH